MLLTAVPRTTSLPVNQRVDMFTFLVNIPSKMHLFTTCKRGVSALCEDWPHARTTGEDFLSSLGHIAKRLPHTMYAVPFDPPLLGRALPVFIWLLHAGHHPNGNKGDALLHRNHHSLSGPQVLIPGWQHCKAALLPVPGFPETEPAISISDGRKVEVFYSVEAVST